MNKNKYLILVYILVSSMLLSAFSLPGIEKVYSFDDIRQLVEDKDIDTAYRILSTVTTEGTSTDEDIKIAYRMLLELDNLFVDMNLMAKHASGLLELSDLTDDTFAEALSYYYFARVFYTQYDDASAIDAIEHLLDLADSENFQLAHVLGGSFYYMLYHSYDDTENERFWSEYALNYCDQLTYDQYWLFPHHAQVITFKDSNSRFLNRPDYSDAKYLSFLNDAALTNENQPWFIELSYSDILSTGYKSIGFNFKALAYKSKQEDIINSLNTGEYHPPVLATILYEKSVIHYTLAQYKEAADIAFGSKNTPSTQEQAEAASEFSDYMDAFKSKKNLKLIEGQQTALLLTSVLLFLLVISVIFVIREYQRIDKLKNIVYEKSIRDGLTGLYNRVYTLDLFEKDPDADTSIAILDIDNFKAINDTFGHLNGDEVLTTIAKIISDQLGDSGYAGRYGGEEFIFIIDKAQNHVAYELSESIRHAIEHQPWSFGLEKVTVSIGLLCNSHASFNERFIRADQLLYQAKHGGKNKVCAENCQKG
ncbi:MULTISPECIES: GGDEF domain-containing protein [unclassified Fusibacter]|uniref:GGDEF domain-containing protein n=1 Tax=unclassified Fusibacter TaxID=2624464 RepID=UPI001011DC2E|nr:MULTISPECIES: GGDEF domain-containing protein [unclassified Fusibacter]MCK8058336.1 GGDEF domain-containing protein [Fusibacter sp. A2]NPE20919.1 diguanylate cyclase [Fusibacter sp. A1]RXV63122.1 diguanylate cyclase [Fusibacter sp. A1]